MPTSTGLYDTSTLTYDTASLSYDGYDAPLANMPAVGVFIAWTDTPLTVSPSWTEISQYVRQISIRRGRQDDLQQFPPGTASLVLDNRERLFDPFNTSGANYANLKPRKQIKIVANWAGVEYPLYRGFVAGWPVEYTEAGLDSTVTIDCFDLIGLIGATTFDADRYRVAVQALSPQTYWTFNELNQPASSAPVVKDYGVYNQQPPFDWTVQSIGGPVARGITSPFFKPDGNADVGYSSSSANFATDWSISFWGTSYRGRVGAVPIIIYAGTLGTASSVILNIIFGINYSPAQVTQWGLSAQMTGAVTVTSDTNKIFVDDTPHHVVINYVRSSGQLRIWVDATDQTVVKTSAANGYTPFPMYVFSWRDQVVYAGGSGRSPNFNPVGVSQFAMFNRTLTSAEIQNLYEIGFGFKNETSSARVNSYITELGLPSGFFNITSSPVANVGDNVVNGKQLLNVLQQIRNTEGGEYFVDDTGVLQFTNRNGVFSGRSATSQMTFTDSGTGVKYDASGVRMAFDADRVRNMVAITTPDGFDAQSENASSITTNGFAGESFEAAFKSLDDAQTYADYFVSIYQNPKLQVEPFMSKGQQDPSYNWPRLLGLELLDRVTFKRTPAVGSAVQRDLLVQSIEHRITPGEWQTVVNGSTRYTGWFIIGVSLIGSSEDVLL
jgi:hypothetical protein